MYYWSSSLHYLQNIKHPIIFINAKDDPLVPEELLEPVKKFCSKLFCRTYIQNITMVTC